MKFHISLVGVLAAAASLAGCGGGKVVVSTPPSTPAPFVASAPSAPPSVVVTAIPSTPPPPAEIATVGRSPGADYIRVEGYYNWLGDHYVWVPATWVRVPHAGATFVPGHWEATTGGYTWLPGLWQ
jgi:hypothetical protein